MGDGGYRSDEKATDQATGKVQVEEGPVSADKAEGGVQVEDSESEAMKPTKKDEKRNALRGLWDWMSGMSAEQKAEFFVRWREAELKAEKKRGTSDVDMG